MRLESVLAATGGRLLNDPFTERFDRLTLDPKRVERGTLFVAKEAQSVPEALRRGAYGILFEPGIRPLDEEIAWIEVDSLTEALPRLLRLWLLENPRRFHTLRADTLHYLDRLNADPNLIALRGSFFRMSAKILESAPEQRIFCADTLFLDRLGVDHAEVRVPEAKHSILSSTLFETTALIEGIYLERVPVPPCTFRSFVRAWALLNALEAKRSLIHLAAPPSFDPLFLYPNGQEAPFGATERVVVLADAVCECGCLEAFDRAEWTGRKIFLPSRIKLDCAIKSPIVAYGSAEELVEKLRKRWHERGYILVAGMTRKSFFEALSRFGPVARDYQTKGLF